jgi:DNA-binding transcriptional LysR family regulator
MDLSQLQVFLAVAQERSFSRAAEKLYRTQPAVSIAVRKLEDSLGQPLVVRGARQIKLTDAGELLKDYAERLLNLRDELVKGLEGLKGLDIGQLSLGANESAIHALLPFLARFHQAYPGVRIAVQRVFSRDIPREILNYRLDLGAVSYVPQDPKLQAVEILRDELTLVVPPNHRLAKKKEVDLSELASETFVAHIVDSPFRSGVMQMFARHNVPLHMDFELPTIESIKRFVEMGMGVAIVPRMCVEWDIDRGRLAEVRVKQMKLPRHLYIVSRRGSRLSHAALGLMKLLKPGIPSAAESSNGSNGASPSAEKPAKKKETQRST